MGTDHLGSTARVTNSSFSPIAQVRYLPYGSARDDVDDAITDDLYTSQKWDASVGLYWFASRPYDPAIGRFTCPDTIVPEPGKPQSLNRYAYCANNPMKYVDPSGHVNRDSDGVAGEVQGTGSGQSSDAGASREDSSEYQAAIAEYLEDAWNEYSAAASDLADSYNRSAYSSAPAVRQAADAYIGPATDSMPTSQSSIPSPAVGQTNVVDVTTGAIADKSITPKFAQEPNRSAVKADLKLANGGKVTQGMIAERMEQEAFEAKLPFTKVGGAVSGVVCQVWEDWNRTDLSTEERAARIGVAAVVGAGAAVVGVMATPLAVGAAATVLGAGVVSTGVGTVVAAVGVSVAADQVKNGVFSMWENRMY